MSINTTDEHDCTFSKLEAQAHRLETTRPSIISSMFTFCSVQLSITVGV